MYILYKSSTHKTIISNPQIKFCNMFAETKCYAIKTKHEKVPNELFGRRIFQFNNLNKQFTSSNY